MNEDKIQKHNTDNLIDFLLNCVKLLKKELKAKTMPKEYRQEFNIKEETPVKINSEFILTWYQILLKLFDIYFGNSVPAEL
jgi:hypothetical protein